MTNLIQLPRPRQALPDPAPLAFFVRVGRNDHRELLDLIATGERGIWGLLIEAQHIPRHRELIAEALPAGHSVPGRDSIIGVCCRRPAAAANDGTVKKEKQMCARGIRP